jgi:hypothetical protein
MGIFVRLAAFRRGRCDEAVEIVELLDRAEKTLKVGFIGFEYMSIMRKECDYGKSRRQVRATAPACTAGHGTNVANKWPTYKCQAFNDESKSI